MNPGWMVGLAATVGLPLALAGPVDPQAPATTPPYRPVFGAPAPDTAPIGWRDANDTVGRFTRGHADLLRAETAPPATPPVPEGDALTLERAVAMGWSRDPRHYTRPGMSPVEQAVATTRAARQAHAVRRAWYQAVAARAQLREHESGWQAADTGAELGQRMQRVGTWNAAQAAHERLQRNEAGIALVHARTEAVVALERLHSTVGTWGAMRQTGLPDALPPLPAQPPSFDGLEQQALEQHPRLRLLNIERLRLAAAVPPARLAQARAVLQAAAPHGYLDTRALPGWTNRLDEALDAEAQADALALDIRMETRAAWLRLRAAHEIATQAHTEALALATQLQQDSQQRYNGMLSSTWDLLRAGRALNDARAAAIQASLDYWLADNDLTAVLVGAHTTGATP